jgi:DNA-binding transcriptional MocR family regulator
VKGLDIPQSTQMVLREGFCEFTWGQPDPDLLPVYEMREAVEDGLSEFGPDSLAYGAAEGAWPLLAWIRDRILRIEGVAVGLDECLGTAGNSDALDQICTLFTSPGDVALVESPTYHLALRVMHDHRLDLHAVPMDAEGLDMSALERTIEILIQADKRPRLLYTIPTFHNPSGISLSPTRRQALVGLAIEHGFLIVEDDVYRELVYEGTAPPSLFGLAPRGVVLRMGSFAKTLAPGLRLGWINGSPEQVRRFADGGLRDSGGSPNFFIGMMVAALCQSGTFEQQVSRLRHEYRARRDALAAALRTHLPSSCRFAVPNGGFFLWVYGPETLDAERLATRAESHKVTFIPGGRFSIDGGNRHAFRLAFSQMKPEDLAEGARRLGEAVREELGNR